VNPCYPAVSERAGHRCEYCRAPEAIFNLCFEVEHIMPLSRGGTDEVDNLALACRACNLHKASHLTVESDEDPTPVRLFHPREDHWEDHFQVDQETGSILGLTPIAACGFGSGSFRRDRDTTVTDRPESGA
jgi:hypothetical protein